MGADDCGEREVRADELDDDGVWVERVVLEVLLLLLRLLRLLICLFLLLI